MQTNSSKLHMHKSINTKNQQSHTEDTQMSLQDVHINDLSTVDINNKALYNNVILDEYIYLKATDLNNKIDDIILLKLKKKVEGKCIKIGYVMPNSIKIVTRSLGLINNANFDGITTYKIQFTADICNPNIGQVIQCNIGNIDKSQIICYIDTIDTSPIEIYLFKHHHLNNNEFLQLKIGNIINVKIGGSKWEYKDKQIITIAHYINTV